MNERPQPMRKLIISGNYAQYRDWLVLHKASPRAAVHIAEPRDLAGVRPETDEIVLVGEYWKNPAYLCDHYRWLVHGRQMAVA